MEPCVNGAHCGTVLPQIPGINAIIARTAGTTLGVRTTDLYADVSQDALLDLLYERQRAGSKLP